MGCLGVPLAVLWGPLGLPMGALGKILDFVENWTSNSEQMGRITAACRQNRASRNSRDTEYFATFPTQQVLLRAPFLHAPGARMTVVELTPSNERLNNYASAGCTTQTQFCVSAAACNTGPPESVKHVQAMVRAPLTKVSQISRPIFFQFFVFSFRFCRRLRDSAPIVFRNLGRACIVANCDSFEGVSSTTVILAPGACRKGALSST